MKGPVTYTQLATLSFRHNMALTVWAHVALLTNNWTNKESEFVLKSDEKLLNHSFACIRINYDYSHQVEIRKV